MAESANQLTPRWQDLPNDVGDLASGPGITLAEVLNMGSLQGATVLAGASGMSRSVRLVNVMEVPDILPWVRPHELLLTTGYPLRQETDALVQWVRALAEHNLAGVAVKLGRYLDKLPDEVLQAADELGLPILSLPEGVGFDDIINQVLHRILLRRSEVRSRAEQMLHELVTIVITGGGLEQVCLGLVSRVGQVAMVTTPDGRVLGVRGGTVTDRDLGPLGELPCFDSTGRFLVEDEPTGAARSAAGVHWVSVRVLEGQRTLGRLVVFGQEQFSLEDRLVVEQSAAAVALVITKQQAVSAVESKYRADFLRDALHGRAGPAERVVAHAHALDWDLDRPMVVVVAEIDPGMEELGSEEERLAQERFAAAWTRSVRPADPRAAVAGFSNEVVALLAPRAGDDRDAVLAQVDSVVRAVRGLGGGGRRQFSVGISRTMADVSRLKDAYEEARKAVEVGRRLHGPQAVSHFDSLGVFRLLSLIPDAEELHKFAAETLGALATDDRPENVDLRETLTVLLERNLNVAETARELHFHYNSLRYRIGKLERILGPFTTDPHRRLAIMMALRVLQMRDL